MGRVTADGALAAAKRQGTFLGRGTWDVVNGHWTLDLAHGTLDSGPGPGPRAAGRARSQPRPDRLVTRGKARRSLTWDARHGTGHRGRGTGSGQATGTFIGHGTWDVVNGHRTLDMAHGTRLGALATAIRAPPDPVGPAPRAGRPRPHDVCCVGARAPESVPRAPAHRPSVPPRRGPSVPGGTRAVSAPWRTGRQCSRLATCPPR